ncbi:ABC transporter ATP-binding protein [Acidaminobacter hydrogenoformans]|uniref:ABC-type quaternary amine transporter n=1 Tax=Acidaminobacter hydrogenoformans DSM 2784 TaxID=1120920 RepID=A0A1G5RW81_9FIRM|nr:ABC transporter ATP-binding protein [Acidaminobacter hydrogenoformans]SCZ78177.1 osmoprotectant transport system ATP-binding protein [Acidaminobacter hydrogenoformans DSM 2784]
MILLKQVFKAYGALEALRGIDLEIPEGECAVLIGPSGCGKSTLLKTINRMVDIDAGTIELGGVDVGAYAPELLRRQIGYCIQGVGLFPHFTVHDNIAVVPRLMKWPEAKIEVRVRELMEMSGLPESYRLKKPKELSGGEAQRVGVCRALAADPPVLLMDEPFGAVDPLTRERLQLAFTEIQKALKKTVVFVTHDVEEAITLADRIVVMNQGRILDAGTPGKFAGALKDDFVVSFLGSEYPLKLLRRYEVSVLALETLPEWRGDLPAGMRDTVPETMPDTLLGAIPDHFSGEAISQPPGHEASLKEVLSEMLRLGLRSIPVRDKTGRLAQVTYEDLAGWLKEVSQV